MPMNNAFKDPNIEEIDREDRKERMIDSVKSANKTQDRVIFGKPIVGKTIKKIVEIFFAVFFLVIATLFVFDVFPNSEVDQQYTLSYVTNGGTEINSSVYDEHKVISLSSSEREGYLFAGWYLDADFLIPVTSTFLNSLEDHGDITVYARWVPEDLEVTLTFNTSGGSLISPKTLLVQSDLITLVPIKGNMYFAGWFLEADYQTIVTEVPFENTRLYAFWSPIQLVTVGSKDQGYDVPIGFDTYSPHYVYGGFQIAKTETTYQLWYDVRIWAEAHGYRFTHLGHEGNDGIEGALPTDSHYEPVTNVSYLDVIVWLNALSEMNGLAPVYRDIEQTIIKDSTLLNKQTFIWAMAQNNGYRLPSFDEWEMAARWTNITADSNYVVFLGNRYWTKGNMVSGAFNNLIQSLTAHAWYQYNSQATTHDVATKNGNDLNIFDMSGNVSEWCYIATPDDRIPIKGGSYLTDARNLGIAVYDFLQYDEAYQDVGFRIAIGSVAD